MKNLFIAAMLLCASFYSHAQEAENDEYELRSGEKMGYIINKKDEKIEGIVRLLGTDKTPWVNQKKVKFIAKADIDPTKKKQKLKVVDADDIKEYAAIQDDGTERHFKMIKYTNVRDGAMGNTDGVSGKVKMIKNFSSTTHLAEVLTDGKITLYRLYGYPSPVASGQADIDQAERDEQNLIDHPSILFQKGKSKPQLLDAGEIKDLVKDCKVVADKLAAGGFSTYDPAVQEKKKTFAGSLIKGETDKFTTTIQKMGMEIFTEYNETCKED